MLGWPGPNVVFPAVSMDYFMSGKDSTGDICAIWPAEHSLAGWLPTFQLFPAKSVCDATSDSQIESR